MIYSQNFISPSSRPRSRPRSRIDLSRLCEPTCRCKYYLLLSFLITVAYHNYLEIQITISHELVLNFDRQSFKGVSCSARA